MSRFTILLGGDFLPTERTAGQIAGSRVIAADSGIRHAMQIGIEPELWVGDFDSVSQELLDEWRRVPREVFPSGKDQTDGELAVAAAVARGATALTLAGAFGGARADHAHLHLAMAVRLAEQGLSVLLTSGWQEGAPILPQQATAYDLADGTLFSILGFSDLEGLTVTGARWPLSRITMPFGSTLTISNEVKGRLSIELGSGRALLVAHPYPAEGF
ncbi:MAG: thiamine diphosphokinase [Rhizobiaceae bacterium]